MKVNTTNLTKCLGAAALCSIISTGANAAYDINSVTKASLQNGQSYAGIQIADGWTSYRSGNYTFHNGDGWSGTSYRSGNYTFHNFNSWR